MPNVYAEADLSRTSNTVTHKDVREHLCQRAARLAARMLNAPIALVCLADDRPFQITAATGAPDPASLLTLVERLCSDARAHPLFVTSGALDLAGAMDPGIQAAACVPLIGANAKLFAWVSVLDRDARIWPEQDKLALLELCSFVATEFALHQTRVAQTQTRRLWTNSNFAQANCDLPSCSRRIRCQ